MGLSNAIPALLSPMIKSYFVYMINLVHDRTQHTNNYTLQAMEFYRSAASMEHPGALYNLGIYYGQGRGGLQHDLETAARLLRLAAVQGQQDAINALKSMDMEIEPPHVEIDPWPRHHPYLHNENHIPSHSSLFVENVNFLLAHTPEATTY